MESPSPSRVRAVERPSTSTRTDDDDSEDDDYVPAVGTLDSDLDDFESDDDVEEEEEDDDGHHPAMESPDRENLSDSEWESDVSLEDEDFGALAAAAVAETPPRSRRGRNDGAFGSGTVMPSMGVMDDPFGGTPTRRGRGLGSAVAAALSADDSRQGRSSPATRAAGAAVDMILEGGFLDDENDEEMLMNAIARRTRARTGAIDDSELAALELALPEIEPEFDWLDEVAEYDRFLSTLNDASASVRDLDRGGAEMSVGDGVVDDDDEDDDDYADENPRAAEYEYRIRTERRAAAKQGGTSAPASVLRRSQRVATGPSMANMRVMKRKREASIQLNKERSVRFALAARSFSPDQVTRLNQQIHQHTQLLFQTLALSVGRPDQVETATAVNILIIRLQQAASMQYQRLRNDKHRAHDASLFAVASADDENAVWYGQQPRKGVYTVFDCQPLRCARDFITAIGAAGAAASTSDSPILWRNPRQMLDLVSNKYTAQQLAEMVPSNSPEFVRADDLFRNAPKTWEETVAFYKNISLPKKAAKSNPLFSNRFKTWTPISRAVYEVTKALIPRISPDPKLLVGGAPLAEHSSAEFTNAEDWLIVVGVQHYGNDYSSIVNQLLVNSERIDVRRRLKSLRTQKFHDNTEVGRALRRAHDHAFRPLDENEIDIIQRTLHEFAAPKKPNLQCSVYYRSLWAAVCARLKERPPKCAFTLWRSQFRGGDVPGTARVGSRRGNWPSSRSDIARLQARLGAQSQNDHVDREEVADSDSEDAAGAAGAYERDKLSDSDSDSDAHENPRSTVTDRTNANASSFTEAQDAAIVSAAAFGVPLHALTEPGAACAGRSHDALIIRFNILKARHRARARS